MHVTKRIDLALLEQQLASAGVVVDGLGHSGTDADGELYTYDASGTTTDLPPEAGPVVEAHVAPPRVHEYAGRTQLSALATSVGSAWTEVARTGCDAGVVYLGTLDLIGIDASAFAAQSRMVRWLWKRPTGGAAVVIGGSMPSEISDSGLNGLDVQLVADGDDVVLQVRGANGQTVAWLGSMEIVAYGVDGLDAATAMLPV